MVSFFRSRTPELNSATLVGLTNAGRQRAEDETEAGIRYDILVSLQQGEKTIGDLARDINEDIDDTKKALARMRGLVRFQDIE